MLQEVSIRSDRWGGGGNIPPTKNRTRQNWVQLKGSSVEQGPWLDSIPCTRAAPGVMHRLDNKGRSGSQKKDKGGIDNLGVILVVHLPNSSHHEGGGGKSVFLYFRYFFFPLLNWCLLFWTTYQELVHEKKKTWNKDKWFICIFLYSEM